jgi:hypothetical protein
MNMKKYFYFLAISCSTYSFAQSVDSLAIELNLDTIHVAEPLRHDRVNTFTLRLSDDQAVCNLLALNMSLVKSAKTDKGDSYKLIPTIGSTSATLIVQFKKGKTTIRGPVYIFRVEE